MHPFVIPWKHQKTVRFPDVFRGKTKGVFGVFGLKKEKYIVYQEDEITYQYNHGRQVLC